MCCTECLKIENSLNKLYQCFNTESQESGIDVQQKEFIVSYFETHFD